MKSCNFNFLFTGLVFMLSLATVVAVSAEKSYVNASGADLEGPVMMEKPSMEAMSADFMRKVMEMSAKIEAMQAKIAERERIVYETHPEVNAMWKRIMDKQRTINSILAEDEELKKLKIERDIMWTIMPSAFSNRKGFSPPSRQISP